MNTPVRYRVEVKDPNAHLFAITLHLTAPAARQHVSLPTWIPGSYLIREFAQHLQRLTALADGSAVPVQAVNKNTWAIHCPAGTAALTLHYEVYAFDASVRTAYLDSERGFFNPTSLCLRVHGQEAQPHHIDVVPPHHAPTWELVTGLRPQHRGHRGWGNYLATDYDELADSPFAMGFFWSGEFQAAGVSHRLVVSGVGPWFDGQRLLQDTQRICEAQLAFWHDTSPHPVPFERYVFLLHTTQDGYGGLEHRNSTALICQRSDLPRPNTGHEPPAPLKATDGYTTLLGLISHEYFHTWNVKRLRPKEFTRYDYDQENHTELLWFFEGFTSYYDDWLLLRTGLIDTCTYLQLLSKTINQVLQTPGRHVQTVAQASFDAWTKYYRVHENTANATVSYYTKGALVALCLDLTLRQEGHTTLDQVMRALYQKCQGGPMREADLRAVLKRLGKRSFDTELDNWVHSTAELPLRTLLSAHGITWQEETAPLAQRLGLRVDESRNLNIKQVLRGSAAEAAGLAAGDEWLGIELNTPNAPQGWRVRKLDDVALYVAPGQSCQALVARDGSLLRRPLTLPAATHTVRLHAPANADTTPAWPKISETALAKPQKSTL